MRAGLPASCLPSRSTRHMSAAFRSALLVSVGVQITAFSAIRNVAAVTIHVLAHPACATLTISALIFSASGEFRILSHWVADGPLADPPGVVVQSSQHPPFTVIPFAVHASFAEGVIMARACTCNSFAPARTAFNVFQRDHAVLTKIETFHECTFFIAFLPLCRVGACAAAGGEY